VIDLHLHTTASDGTLLPAALVARAAQSGLTTISVTDHDTTAGLDEARAAATQRGLSFVDGIEITAVQTDCDVHVLGYFFNPRAPSLQEFVRRQRAARVRRVQEMRDRLEALGYTIDIAPLLHAASAEGRSLGRPQLADALVGSGYALNRQEAFERLLGRGRAAYVARSGPAPAEVISVIRGAGGIASLAHPALLGMDELIPDLARSGLAALEARHSDQDAEAELHYRGLAARLGLAVTGGSDFHGDSGHRTPRLGAVTLPAEDFVRLEVLARSTGSSAHVP
jgi:predicted metal-dependent phosphoesterase TrpH